MNHEHHIVYPLEQHPKRVLIEYIKQLTAEIDSMAREPINNGRLGGQSTSAAKVKAARKNGKLGGRPKRAALTRGEVGREK